MNEAAEKNFYNDKNPPNSPHKSELALQQGRFVQCRKEKEEEEEIYWEIKQLQLGIYQSFSSLKRNLSVRLW